MGFWKVTIFSSANIHQFTMPYGAPSHNVILMRTSNEHEKGFAPVNFPLYFDNSVYQRDEKH
jgi:hypothetical protein